VPRIRTIKPEFWSSPDTASASAVARLTYIAMWNWCDDHGRGTANLKELEGFIFPLDDIEELSHGNARKFRDVVAEVQDAYAVTFYRVRGRDYYEIPAWDAHQKNERRAKSKYPGPDEGEEYNVSGATRDNTPKRGDARNFRDTDTETPDSSGTGTGEQGNRGTGEQTPTSAPADADETTPDHDVEAICTHLADRIEANGARRPTITKTWRKDARLLIHKDGYTPQQIHWLIDWCQTDPFWCTNILSMPKLREKFEQLKLKAKAEAQPAKSKRQQEVDAFLAATTPTVLEVTQ